MNPMANAMPTSIDLTVRGERKPALREPADRQGFRNALEGAPFRGKNSAAEKPSGKMQAAPPEPAADAGGPLTPLLIDPAMVADEAETSEAPPSHEDEAPAEGSAVGLAPGAAVPPPLPPFKAPAHGDAAPMLGHAGQEASRADEAPPSVPPPDRQSSGPAKLIEAASPLVGARIAEPETHRMLGDDGADLRRKIPAADAGASQAAKTPAAAPTIVALPQLMASLAGGNGFNVKASAAPEDSWSAEGGGENASRMRLSAAVASLGMRTVAGPEGTPERLPADERDARRAKDEMPAETGEASPHDRPRVAAEPRLPSADAAPPADGNIRAAGMGPQNPLALAPLVVSASPREVAGAFAANLPGRAPAPGAAPTTEAAAASPPNGERTLLLELRPAALGPLTARLKLEDAKLTVEIAVATEAARERLGADGSEIVRALEALGLSVDRVTVTLAEGSSPAREGGAGPRHDGENGNPFAGGEAEGGERKGGRAAGGARGQADGTAHGGPESAAASSGALYI